MNIKQFRRVLFVITLNIQSAFASDSTPLTLAIPTPETAPAYMFFSLYYSELFSRIGREITLVSMPAARAKEHGNIGKVDGQVGRSFGYETITRNQLRVPESVVSIPFGVYAKQPNQYKQITDWDSLKSVNLRVEYQRGATIPSEKLKELVPTKQLNAVTRTLQGLEMLNAGRTDIFIGAEVLVNPYLVEPKFNAIYQVSRLGVEDIYLYLHESHTDLAAPLATEIKKIKEHGLVNEFLSDALRNRHSEKIDE